MRTPSRHRIRDHATWYRFRGGVAHALQRLPLNSPICAAVVLGCLAISISADAKEPRPRLAILPISAVRVAPGTVQILQELLTNEVDRYGLYDVLSVADLNAMLGFERMKDMAGCDDVACAAEVGGALGVRYLVASTIGRLGSDLVISLKLIDTQTMTVLQRAEESVADDEAAYARGLRTAVARLLGRERPPHRESATNAAGSLRVESTPPGAACLLDGKPIGVTPCAVSSMPPGVYNLQVAREGYQAHQELVPITAGTSTNRQVALKPLPIEVRFASVPAGAEVFLDDASVGTTPLSLQLMPQTYAVRFMLATFAPRTLSVTLSPGDPLKRVDARLDQLPARVSVRATPPGALVRALAASGSDGARAPAECATDCELTLPAGEYILDIERADHDNQTQRVVAAPGGHEVVEVTLLPGLSNTQRETRAGRFRFAVGFTALAVAGGTVFAWQGNEARDAANGLAGATWGGEAAATMSRGRRAAVIADVGLVVGVAASLAASYFWARLAL